MTMIRKVVPAQIKELAADEVEVIISTGQLARDGHVFEPRGALLDNYQRNPIVLWQHDPEMPVGRAESVVIDDNKIVSRIRFAPEGISAKADEIRGLVKSGIVSGVSVGMEPIDAEPLNPGKPRGGQRITAWELLEVSFCSVPVDTGAGVTARAKRSKEPKMKLKLRGMYELANLACLLQSLGYAYDAAEFEEALEGDDSQACAMLGEGMKAVGAALCQMADEEVMELLDKIDGADEDVEVVTSEQKVAAAGDGTGTGASAGDGTAAPYGQGPLSEDGVSRSRTDRWARAMKRAVKNQALQDGLQTVDGHHVRAMKHHRALDDSHRLVGDGLEKMRAFHAKASESVNNAHDALEAAKGGASDGKDGGDRGANAEGNGKDGKRAKRAVDDAMKQVNRAHRALKQAKGAMEKVEAAHTDLNDHHQDVGDSHNAMGRSVRSAQRVNRTLMDAEVSGSTEDDGKDTDSHKMQDVKGESKDVDKEGGTSKGRSNDAEYRRRQREILELTPVQ